MRDKVQHRRQIRAHNFGCGHARPDNSQPTGKPPSRAAGQTELGRARAALQNSAEPTGAGA